MFRIAERNEGIQWPVHINEPQAGGATQRHVIQVYFILKPQPVINELIEQGDAEFLAAVIDSAQGWEGVTRAGDGGDVPVRYSREALEELISIPYVRAGFIEGYFSFVSGIQRKNSKAPRSTG
jgi:hypothetical protein